MDFTFLWVMLISATPVLEIKAGLPYALHNGFAIHEALMLSIAGNTLVIVFLLTLLAHLEVYFLRIPLLQFLYERLIVRVRRKYAGVRKYGKVALFLLTVIPLPGTGAWTACIAAFLFKFNRMEAFWIIFFGVLTSSLLILILNNIIFSEMFCG